jgi:hypothetical protein
MKHIPKTDCIITFGTLLIALCFAYIALKSVNII